MSHRWLILSVVEKNILYFNKPGFRNTNSVIKAVKKRIECEDIEYIIVPATTGKTANQFSHKLGELAKIITISENEVVLACKRLSSTDKGLQGKRILKYFEKKSDDTKDLHRKIFDLTFLPICGEAWNVAREVLYAFGQGMKVAIEVSLAAVEIKKVKPYIKVIAVGGTGEGADIAIVVKTAPQNEAFGKDPEKRLSIEEILAMPSEKW